MLSEDLTNSLHSVGTSQSLVIFTDVLDDKPETIELPISKEVDREGYHGENEESDEEPEPEPEPEKYQPEQPRSKPIGIEIPKQDPNSLSPSNISKRHHEGPQNCRKTLRLTSEQIVSFE